MSHWTEVIPFISAEFRYSVDGWRGTAWAGEKRLDAGPGGPCGSVEAVAQDLADAFVAHRREEFEAEVRRAQNALDLFNDGNLFLGDDQ
jgi:hypothetical protein